MRKVFIDLRAMYGFELTALGITRSSFKHSMAKFPLQYTSTQEDTDRLNEHKDESINREISTMR